MNLRVALENELLGLRGAIREHRNPKGHDRCWLDDDILYQRTIEGYMPIGVLCSREDFMRLCHLFKANRRDDIVPSSCQEHDRNWDEDLEYVSVKELICAIDRTRTAIVAHYEKGEAKTAADDRALYAVLPDEIVADLRLPEDFPVGCESFYEDCLACIPPEKLLGLPPWPINPQKLHEWKTSSPFVGERTRKP